MSAWLPAAVTLLAAPGVWAQNGTLVDIHVGRSGTKPCVHDHVFPNTAEVTGSSSGVDFRVCNTCFDCPTGNNERYRLEVRDEFDPGYAPLPCTVDLIVPPLDTTFPCLIGGPPNARYRYRVTVCLVGGECTSGDPEIWVRRDTLAPPLWLEGLWRSIKGETTREEYWTRDGAGSMVGVLRTARAGVVGYEVMRIEPADPFLKYSVTQNGRTVGLDMSHLDKNSVAFGRRSTEPLQRVERQLRSDGSLTVTNRMLLDGKLIPDEWQYARVP